MKTSVDRRDLVPVSSGIALQTHIINRSVRAVVHHQIRSDDVVRWLAHHNSESVQSIIFYIKTCQAVVRSWNWKGSQMRSLVCLLVDHDIGRSYLTRRYRHYILEIAHVEDVVRRLGHDTVAHIADCCYLRQ